MWNLGQLKGIKLYDVYDISIDKDTGSHWKRVKVFAEFRLDRFYLDTLYIKQNRTAQFKDVMNVLSQKNWYFIRRK